MAGEGAEAAEAARGALAIAAGQLPRVQSSGQRVEAHGADLRIGPSAFKKSLAANPEFIVAMREFGPTAIGDWAVTRKRCGSLARPGGCGTVADDLEAARSARGEDLLRQKEIRRRRSRLSASSSPAIRAHWGGYNGLGARLFIRTGLKNRCRYFKGRRRLAPNVAGAHDNLGHVYTLLPPNRPSHRKACKLPCGWIKSRPTRADNLAYAFPDCRSHR